MKVKELDWCWTKIFNRRIQWLFNFMKQSPSGESNWFSASQEIPRILRNSNVHYHIQNLAPPVPFPEPDQSTPCLPIPLL